MVWLVIFCGEGSIYRSGAVLARLRLAWDALLLVAVSLESPKRPFVLGQAIKIGLSF